MISNNIAHWRSIWNRGKGISRAHLARKIRVGRSYVTKLEKGTAQPSAEIMFRVARYFEQSIESIFQYAADGEDKTNVTRYTAMPTSQLSDNLSSSCPSNKPEPVRDKSLVSPTAKVVASPVAR